MKKLTRILPSTETSNRKWQMFSTSTVKITANTILCHMNKGRLCIILKCAVPPNSAATSSNATSVASSGSPITHAGIGIAQNAKLWPRNSGSMTERASCFPAVIFISFSPCHMTLTRSYYATKKSHCEFSLLLSARPYRHLQRSPMAT